MSDTDELDQLLDGIDSQIVSYVTREPMSDKGEPTGDERWMVSMRLKLLDAVKAETRQALQDYIKERELGARIDELEEILTPTRLYTLGKNTRAEYLHIASVGSRLATLQTKLKEKVYESAIKDIKENIKGGAMSNAMIIHCRMCTKLLKRRSHEVHSPPDYCKKCWNDAED